MVTFAHISSDASFLWHCRPHCTAKLLQGLDLAVHGMHNIVLCWMSIECEERYNYHNGILDELTENHYGHTSHGFRFHNRRH